MGDHRVIRLTITLDHRAAGHLSIENDETGSEACAHYNVVFDDLATRRQTKARVEYFPRTERIGLELIASACKALVEAALVEAGVTEEPR